ncbi:MAG: VOC family protein [Actinobacteria bacterium]|nr:VOC family protein [Actinomycetota bacterium]
MASIRPALVLQNLVMNVVDLDRSVEFYENVTHLRETVRDAGVAILAGPEPGSSMLYLRQAGSHAMRTGADFVGVRSVTWEVPSFAELDRVEHVLRARDAFRDRHFVEDDPDLAFVISHDPDRLPLGFVASRSGAKASPASMHKVSGYVYSIDA